MVQILRGRSHLVLGIVAAFLFITNNLLIIQNIQLRSTVEKLKPFVTEEGYKFSDLKVTGPD